MDPEGRFAPIPRHFRIEARARRLMIVMILFLVIPPSIACQETPSAGVAAAAVPTEVWIARIDSVLRAHEERGMNGVILIRRRDTVLLHDAYGSMDREAGRPMTLETGFTIGSLVKPITAVAILKLEGQGKLSTADTLGRFFPSAPPDKARITLQQLLAHTSGLRGLFGGDYQVVSRDWVLERAMEAELLFEPGAEERYSNSGYTLLAMIVEDVSGRPYEAFVREEVLLPAGVEDIGYVRAGWTNDRLAVGYRADGSRWGTTYERPWAEDGPSWNLRGNGGMLGTVEAMARWYEALFDGKVLGPAALDEFYELDAGESRSVGGLALAHAGGNGIFNSLQVSWIAHDTHMTLFTSTANPLNAETVWRAFRDDVVELAREAAADANRRGGA